jgi:hypothetical protein
MKTYKSLPLMLGSLHAIFAATVFGLAIRSPERGGLLPLLVYYVDYPLSIVLDGIRHILHRTGSLQYNLFADAFTFVILGSLWFYCIGILLRLLLVRERTA